MKKATITISFDEEKLSALKMYMEQKGNNVEGELEKSMESLYTKNVPAGVRNFIDMKSGTEVLSKPKPRNLKIAVPAEEASEKKGASEVKANG